MTGLFQDLRYAVRQLRRNPGFTAIAVITLALGIGANTGIFTLVNAVLLKSLPVPRPQQLSLVRRRDRFAEQTRISYPLYDRMLKAMPDSASLAAMTRVGDFYVGVEGSRPEMTKGQLVSGNYFQAFETYPLLGRLLTPEDNRIVDGHPVAVISYGCWKQRFAGAANVIGRELTVNGERFAVVGVTDRDFFGIEPGKSPDVWLPLMMQSSLHYAQHYSQGTSANVDKPWVSQNDITWLYLMVRARDRDALGHIAGVLNQLFVHNQWERYGQATAQDQNAQFESQLDLVPGGQGIEALQREFSQPLLVLTGMVGLILLIACANLASLLLARATSRTREIAMRLSLGATRRRLIRQLVTECFLLSAIGGLLGIGVAYWCDEVLPKWASGGSEAIPLNLAPDGRVLLFSILIVATAAALSGIAPALQAVRINPIDGLKANSGWSSEASSPKMKWSLRQTLIVGQFALSLVLLVGAGLFLQTLTNFARVNPGFDREHILNVWFDTTIRHYSHDQLLSFYQRVIDRIQELPGVRSASLAVCPLASNCRNASDIYLPGVDRVVGTPQTNVVSLDYFQNVGVPGLAGRVFVAADDEKAPHVAVINQTLATQIFGGKDAIGRSFGFDASSANEFQVVGIVADAQVNGVQESVPPMIYFPLLQTVTNVESLDIRATGDPASLVDQVRQVLKSVDPDLPIGEIGTVAEQLSSNLAQERLVERLTMVFAAVALSLACLGLYGVTAYVVTRRTREIGVRLALGALRGTVLWLVLRQMLILIGMGIAAGVFLSLVSARSVASLLFGLSPYDPATILAAAAVLAIVSVAAGLRPALRAMRVDPMVALRYE